MQTGKNKAVYTAFLVACGWAGAVIKKANQAFGQEQYCKKKTLVIAKKAKKSDGYGGL